MVYVKYLVGETTSEFTNFSRTILERRRFIGNRGSDPSAPDGVLPNQSHAAKQENPQSVNLSHEYSSSPAHSAPSAQQYNLQHVVNLVGVRVVSVETPEGVIV